MKTYHFVAKYAPSNSNIVYSIDGETLGEAIELMADAIGKLQFRQAVILACEEQRAEDPRKLVVLRTVDMDDGKKPVGFIECWDHCEEMFKHKKRIVQYGDVWFYDRHVCYMGKDNVLRPVRTTILRLAIQGDKPHAAIAR